MTEPDGCVDVRFDVPADTPSGTFVVFEDLLVDGIVVDAHFVQRAEVGERLGATQPCVVEPLLLLYQA